jgi:hypothetical protein
MLRVCQLKVDSGTHGSLYRQLGTLPLVYSAAVRAEQAGSGRSWKEEARTRTFSIVLSTCTSPLLKAINPIRSLFLEASNKEVQWRNSQPTSLSGRCYAYFGTCRISLSSTGGSLRIRVYHFVPRRWASVLSFISSTRLISFLICSSRFSAYWMTSRSSSSPLVGLLPFVLQTWYRSG